jgi:hypothetical protein
MGKCASSLLPVRLAKLVSLVTSLSRACWRCHDFPSLILTTSLLCAPYLTSSTTDLSRRSYRLHHHSRRQLPPFSQRTYLPSPFSSLPFPSPQRQVTWPIRVCSARLWILDITLDAPTFGHGLEGLELPRKTKDNMKENSQVLERKAQAHSKKTRGRPPMHTSLAPQSMVEDASDVPSNMQARKRLDCNACRRVNKVSSLILRP